MDTLVSPRPEVQLPRRVGRQQQLSKGPASLTAANYASGADAALDSWVILKKANKE